MTVKHPKDALCTLRIKGGAFDLVVSDVHMPDMNGFELQQAIAQEFDLPVVCKFLFFSFFKNNQFLLIQISCFMFMV